jgi:hypothetical protein
MFATSRPGAIYDPATGRNVCDPFFATGLENDCLVPRVDFDFSLLDGESEPETMISITQASSALVRVLDWLARSQNFASIGAKALALRALLGSPNNPYRSVSKIAKATGISRAAISKSLLNLADQYGIRLNTGKLETSRLAYREAQLRALERRSHSSFRRNGANAPQNPVTAMKLIDKPKTLDSAITALKQANTQIAQLKEQLASRPSQASGNTGSRSSPKPQPAQSATPLKVTDLSTAEIAEAMDICNREHDTETLSMLYRELNARRRPI